MTLSVEQKEIIRGKRCEHITEIYKEVYGTNPAQDMEETVNTRIEEIMMFLYGGSE